MILLTGSTGFLGSALLKKLLSRGDEVIAICRSTSNKIRIQECLDSPILHIFEIDTTDPSPLFDNYPVDTILHTATEYGRGTTPLYDILNANLTLPLRLAELGAKAKVKCFINTDSFFNKYGNSYSNLLNYSLSKKSLLIWLEKLSKQLKIINVVLEHMYGYGDSQSKFVEDMINKVAIDKVHRVSLTHGHQRRDFIYLDDVVDAFLLLIDYGRLERFSFESFELGTGETTQVRDLVKIIKSISKSPTILGFGDIDYRQDEIMSSSADISRLRRLGWHPSVTLEEGLRRIIHHY